MKLGEGFIEVRPDTSRFKQELQQNVEVDAASVSRRLGQALAGGAFLVGAKKAVDAASDLQQAVGGTSAVFGQSAESVERWSKAAAESAGLSERAARELTAQLGGLLKGFGYAEEEAAGLSTQLAQLGADLAATFGGKPEEAVQALAAAMRGETDPLERFGIALNQTLVNAKAVELGLAATTSSVDQHAKAQATLALITERSADAQGQFAREADTAAGQAAISAAKAENASADLGENLLPIYTKLSETVGRVADVFGALPEPVQTGILAIAGIAALSGPIKAAGEAFGGMVSIVRRSPAAFDKAAIGAFNLTGNLGGIARVAAGPAAGAIGILAIAMYDAQKRADEMNRAAKELREEVERTGDSLEDVAVRKLVEDFTGNERTRDAMRALGVSFEDLRGPLRGSREEYEQWLHALQEEHPGDARVEILARRVSEARGALGEARAATDATSDAVADLGGEAVDSAPKVEKLTEEIDVNKEAADRAAESVDKFREAVERALAPLDFQGAMDERTQALQDLAAGIDERAQAVKDARQRIKDLQATKPEDRPDDFARQMADAQAALREALDATSLTLEGNSEAALRNRDELRGLVDDSVAVIESARDQGRSLDDLILIRANEVQSLRDQLTQMGYNKEQIEVYIDSIEAIPLDRTTVLSVDDAKAQIQLEAAIKRLNRQIELNPLSIDVAGAERFAAGPRSVTGHAAGGQVFDGDFIVGEAGVPELLRKRGSDVEVIAGSPTALGGTALSADLLVAMREQNALLAQIAGNTAGPTTGQRLRRVQTMAGAV